MKTREVMDSLSFPKQAHSFMEPHNFGECDDFSGLPVERRRLVDLSIPDEIDDRLCPQRKPRCVFDNSALTGKPRENNLKPENKKNRVFVG